MSKKNPKVLVVATSRRTRGGITSVVKAHETGAHWKAYHCKWIETHIDRGTMPKLWYFCKSLLQFAFLIPFYDLVHIHFEPNTSARRKRFYFAIAKLWNKKIITHLHASDPKYLFEQRNQKILSYLFYHSDRVLVLSQQWKQWLNEALNMERHVSVLYNPAPTVEAMNNFHSRKKQILFAGTLIERKGYVDLIKAFSLIAPKYPDWTVIFAGNGELEKATALAKDLKTDRQVIFKGWIAGEEKDKTFREASVFCLASYAEGFPMAVLDAWAYGLPVVATPVGGLPDVLNDGKNALIFQAGDTEHLARQLDRLISEDELRSAISRESLKLSNTVFNIETINKQLAAIYKEVLQK